MQKVVLGVAAVVVAFVVIGLVLSAYMARLVVEPMALVSQIPDVKDRLAAERDLLQYQTDSQIKIWTVIVQVLGGLALGVTAYAAWRNFQLGQQNLEATKDKIAVDRASSDANLQSLNDQLQVDREGQITNRFTQAVSLLGEELGNGKPNIEARLGAIYALERIARDSSRDHWTIVEILSAYVRQNSAWSAAGGGSGAVAPKPRTDVQAALTVLGRRDVSSEEHREITVDLTATDLRGADLKGTHLERADLRGAHLEGIVAWDAHFDHAQLRDAHLVGADLMNASLVRANLMHAHLEQATLVDADLSNAHFDQTHLEAANLGSAVGLTPGQIASAILDAHTRIPAELRLRLKDPDAD